MGALLDIINNTKNTDNLFDLHQEKEVLDYFSNKNYKISAPGLISFCSSDKHANKSKIKKDLENEHQDLLNRLDEVLKNNINNKAN